MTAGREDLGDARGSKPCFRQAEGGTQAGTAGANDDYVVTVIDEFVIAHKGAPSATFSTANTAAVPRNRCTNLLRIIETTFRAGPRT